MDIQTLQHIPGSPSLASGMLQGVCTLCKVQPTKPCMGGVSNQQQKGMTFMAKHRVDDSAIRWLICESISIIVCIKEVLQTPCMRNSSEQAVANKGPQSGHFSQQTVVCPVTPPA